MLSISRLTIFPSPVKTGTTWPGVESRQRRKEKKNNVKSKLHLVSTILKSLLIFVSSSIKPSDHPRFKYTQIIVQEVAVVKL